MRIYLAGPLFTQAERAWNERIADRGPLGRRPGAAWFALSDLHLPPDAAACELQMHERGARYGQLIEATRPLAPVRTAVVHPCDRLSLEGALEAAKRGLILPILVGPRGRINAAAAEAGVDLGHVEIVDTPHSHAAAARAVALVREGRTEALMKGKLHTDELMEAIVDHTTGLRTERRMSHVFALDVPSYPRPLFVTDAAINIDPDIDVLRDIVQNAIDLAHALGMDEPKVALLSAVETVNPQIPSTLDAAALSKMSERGQIKGGIVDGPLAMDNAMDAEAAKTKGVTGLVAGHAEVLIVPNLESGNMLAKELAFVAGAEAAGIALGATVPIILTSRADGEKARLASCAIAVLYRYWQENGQPIGVRLAEAAE